MTAVIPLRGGRDSANTLIPWEGQRESVFRDRYAASPAETPHLMWQRVAKTLAADEDEFGVLFETLRHWRFVPGGRILSGAGVDGARTLYNCYTMMPSACPAGRDSRGAISALIGRMLEVTARGGGVGVDWSCLRPEGYFIHGVGAFSDGPVAWMRGADAVMDAVRQGGTRTAALMFTLHDWHPDVVRFAEASFLRANHSVCVSDNLMASARKGWSWPLRFPDTTHPDYDGHWNGNIETWENSGRPIIEHGSRPADELLRAFARAAAKTGNPGLVFLERANRRSPLPLRTLFTTNPCGEVPMYEDGSCNLGAVNLLAHWDHETGRLDYSSICDTVRGGVRLLNRVIDRSRGFDKRLDEVQRGVRRIGIGVMGLADVLLLSGVRYGSSESLDMVNDIFRLIYAKALSESARMARDEGPAPEWGQAVLNSGPAYKLDREELADVRRYGLRNCFLTSQAPTGTTSVLAGASSGIEPVFSDRYTRRDATGEHTVRHPLFPVLPGDRRDHHVTAHDLSVTHHIAVQAAAQRWIDSGVSKTVNLPAGSGAEAVMQAYGLAWDMGCVGITAFVDGCRDGVLTPCGPDGCDL